MNSSCSATLEQAEIREVTSSDQFGLEKCGWVEELRRLFRHCGNLGLLSAQQAHQGVKIFLPAVLMFREVDTPEIVHLLHCLDADLDFL
jgi:hypothetical protein